MKQEQQLIPYQVSELPDGPWLIFAPHADDETFGMGGAILLAKEQGIEVSVVIMTDGARASVKEVNHCSIRKEEAKAAASSLGLARLYFLEEPDRGLSLRSETQEKIRRILNYRVPTSVFIPSVLEPHPDHRKTAAIVWEALKVRKQDQGLAPQILSYEISVQSPVNCFLDISSVIDEKHQIMALYDSQTALNNYIDVVMALNKSRTYSLPEGILYAEGFFKYNERSTSLESDFYQTIKNYWQMDLEDYRPLVSVIIRTKDRPHLLKDAIQSVITQTYNNIELIIVNDGGQDVAEQLLPVRQALAKVNYVLLEKNLGRAGAANVGLQQAQGDFIQFLDDDDIIYPQHISELVNILQQNKDVLAAYSDIQAENGFIFNYPFNKDFLRVWNYIPIHSVLFSSDLIKNKGCLFDEKFEAFEDWDFWLQVCNYTNFYHHPFISGEYRQLGNSEVGTFAHNDNTESHRYKVLNKWLSHWDIGQLDGIFHTLREYPSAREEQISVQNQELQERLINRNKQVKQLENLLGKNQGKIIALNEQRHQQQREIQLFQQQLIKRQDSIAQLHQQLNHERQQHTKQIQQLSQHRQQLEKHLELVNLQLQMTFVRRVKNKLHRMLYPLRQITGLFRIRAHHMQLKPENLKRADDGVWQSHLDNGCLELISPYQQTPVGWVLVTGKIQIEHSDDIKLFFALEKGRYTPAQSFFLDQENGNIRALFQLPGKTVGLKFCYMKTHGSFKLSDIVCYQFGRYRLFKHLLSCYLKNLRQQPAPYLPKIVSALRILFSEGKKGVTKKLLSFYHSYDYQRWLRVNDVLTHEDKVEIASRISSITNKASLTILMWVDLTSSDYLEASLRSLEEQIYQNWNLLIVLPTTYPGKKTAQIKKKIKHHQNISVVTLESRQFEVPESITGDYTFFMQCGDELAPHALYCYVEKITQFPQARLVYSDEDQLDQQKQERHSPIFKPDWNPLFLDSGNYIGLPLVQTEMLRRIKRFTANDFMIQVYELNLRMTESQKAENILHIPHVLVHRLKRDELDDCPPETSFSEVNTQKIVAEHLDRKGGSGYRISAAENGGWRINYPIPRELPLVSIIIPTYNQYHIFRQCIESIINKTSYKNYEILVVDNASDDPEIIDYFLELGRNQNIRILSYKEPFNYSAINNFAVKHANGDILAFLNNDVEVISSDWLEDMLSLAVQKEYGVVGAMLYYPDNTVQHAGIITGIGDVAGHAWITKPKGFREQSGQPPRPRNVSAVTAACALVRRELFDKVGGFNDTELPITYNDVDLCLKISEAGYFNAWTPYAELYHHESVSRGADDSREKRLRYLSEVDYMHQRWGEILYHDPAYNPNLSLRYGHYELALNSRASKPWK